MFDILVILVFVCVFYKLGARGSAPAVFSSANKKTMFIFEKCIIFEKCLIIGKMSYNCKMSTHCRMSTHCKMSTNCKMSTHCKMSTPVSYTHLTLPTKA